MVFHIWFKSLFIKFKYYSFENEEYAQEHPSIIGKNCLILGRRGKNQENSKTGKSRTKIFKTKVYEKCTATVRRKIA